MIIFLSNGAQIRRYRCVNCRSKSTWIDALKKGTRDLTYIPRAILVAMAAWGSAALFVGVLSPSKATLAKVHSAVQKGDSSDQDDSKKKKPDKKEPYGITRSSTGMHLHEIGPISPNGQSVVLVGRKHDTAPNAFIMDLNGLHTEHQVTGLRVGVNDPVWSPAGDLIAFDGVDAAGLPQIYILNVASGQVHALTRNNFTNRAPVFTPDGKRLLFTSDESPLPDAAFGIQHVASIVVTGGKPEYFTEDETSSIMPKVSPDGKSIFLVKVEEQSGRHSLWEYGLGGKPIRDLTSDKLARINSYIVNAAAGNIVIWGQEQPERQDEIYILDLKTGNLTPLSDPDLPKRNPAISPDGKLIAFVGPAGEGNFLFLYDFATGTIQQLSKKGSNSFTPVFASNTTILFGSDRDAEQEGDFNEVYTVDLTNVTNPPKKNK
jgi:Tol biopolymer transport system component